MTQGSEISWVMEDLLIKVNVFQSSLWLLVIKTMSESTFSALRL